MDNETLIRIVKEKNPKLSFLDIEEKENMILCKVDSSRVTMKLIEYTDFFYNAYVYLEGINRVKAIKDLIGFTYKKGGIVGVTTSFLGENEKKSKDKLKNTRAFSCQDTVAVDLWTKRKKR